MGAFKDLDTNLQETQCFIVMECTDELAFKGTYDECKLWLIKNDPFDDLDYLIVSRETGRALSVVFDNASLYQGFLEMRT